MYWVCAGPAVWVEVERGLGFITKPSINRERVRERENQQEVWHIVMGPTSCYPKDDREVPRASSIDNLQTF